MFVSLKFAPIHPLLSKFALHGSDGWFIHSSDGNLFVGANLDNSKTVSPFKKPFYFVHFRLRGANMKKQKLAEEENPQDVRRNKHSNPFQNLCYQLDLNYFSITNIENCTIINL